MSQPSLLSDLAQLTKVRISAAASFTAAAGYIAFARTFHVELLVACLGTVLMAMGSSTLNEFQERELDARMPRTRNRPLPRGSFTPGAALALGLSLGFLGFGVLLLAHGWAPALLGALAMAWYNGLYTPLKRRTPFAVVPGSLIGAIPPALGWTAAGGQLLDPGNLALCFIFFIWQVPHFWLLMGLHEEGYAQAGFPTLHGRFRPDQVARLIFTWMAFTALATPLLPAFRTLSGLPAMALLGAVSLWLLAKGLGLLHKELDAKLCRRTFMQINVFALVLILAVVLDPWLR